MDQIRYQFRLADKIIDKLLLVGVVLADNFHGDAFNEVARAMLLGLVDNAHTAFEDFSNDIVAKLTLDREEGHKTMLAQTDSMSTYNHARSGSRSRYPNFS